MRSTLLAILLAAGCASQSQNAPATTEPAEPAKAEPTPAPAPEPAPKPAEPAPTLADAQPETVGAAIPGTGLGESRSVEQLVESLRESPPSSEVTGLRLRSAALP